MKCENCFHAGVCLHRINYEDYDCECANYKDKSLIVELPCKVGDKVYILIDESEKFGGSYIKEEKVTEISTAGRIWTDDCYYDSDDVGKNVFLSREEAERALEEINNEKNNN